MEKEIDDLYQLIIRILELYYFSIDDRKINYSNGIKIFRSWINNDQIYDTIVHS